MSRYRKYTDNYQAMLDALRIPFHYPSTTEAEKKALFINQLLIDKSRATVVELRASPHSASQSEDLIYNPAHYDLYPHYSQGDFDGRVFSTLFITNPNFREAITDALTSSDDHKMLKKVGFPYINDQGIFCGVAIFRFGHEPDAQYTLVHIQNINDTIENRIVTLICSDQLTEDEHYTSLRGAHAEQILNEKDILPSLEQVINSPSIYQLLQTTIGENGKISEEKLDLLETRLQRHNLDNRDLFMHQVPQIMENAAELDPTLARQIRRYYDKNRVNFFEPQQYKQLLLDLLSEAELKIPKNPQITTALQDIYLEYLIINLYQTHVSYRNTYIQEGIPATLVESMKTEISANSNQIIPVEEFTQKANQMLQNTDYQDRLRRLETNANIQDKSDIAALGKKQLLKLKKINLANLKPKQQKSVIQFTSALNDFIQKPDLSTYTRLHKLYPKLHLDQSELEKLIRPLELSNYEQQLLLLEASIADTQHPYLKQEAEKKLKYLKTLSTDRISNADLRLRIDFVETLDNFINNNLRATLEKLKNLYDKMEKLTPMSEEKVTNLLLSLNMARVQQQRLEKHYTWDPQGRVLVTILDSEHHNQPSTYSLDIHHHADIDKEYQDILEQAVRIQTSDHATQEILQWFYQNQTGMYPLQQALQIYLNQIGQTLQKEIGASVSDEILHQALLNTAQAINDDVVQCLVTGLIKASIHMGTMVPQRELQTVNQVLIEAREPLQIKAQSILMTTLREKIQEFQTEFDSTPPNSEAKALDFDNKIVYFDTSESLITSIETKQPDPSFSSHQINTYHGNETNFRSFNPIHRLRVQSSGLNVPHGMSDTTYPAHFQHRFLQISDTYRCYKSPPVILYALAASNQQLKQMLNAAHHYNRSQHTQNMNHPMCFLQSFDMSEPGRILGYPTMLDWSGTAELTIMHEMALCSQISTLDLDPYRRFLNPPSSILSSLFKTTGLAPSPEGKQIRAQIESFKANWQQNENTEPDLSMQQSVTKALQKLMAFDIHLDPKYGLLIQAMSLAIAKQALLSDESPGEVLAHALSHTHIFDLETLPEEIQEPFNMLLRARDKHTATVGADLLITAMKTYCQQHPNSAGAAMVPVIQQQIFAAQRASATTNIQAAKNFLATSPRRMQKQTNSESRHQSPRKLDTRPQQQKMSSQSSRLFTSKKNPKEIKRSPQTTVQTLKKR